MTTLVVFSNIPPQENTSTVLVLDIKSNIDPRITRYVKLGLEEADRIGADYILIDMDTYGGILTDADEIRTMLLEYEKPVWVFIDKDAASAGALISIACDSIYMAAGASIGAATVVTPDGTAAPDKYQSYMRSTMRSTAEANGRDPKIAEGMVDEDIEIEGVTEAGDVITFSTSEAIKHGFCEGQRASLEDLLEQNGITEFEITTFKLGRADKIIEFFINPFISGILILVIIGGIYFEIQTPGVGFPILAAFIALLLYLVPYYMNGLAENWEVAMFFVGVALIALEIFVIPGFGIAGIAGLTFTLGSLILIMVNNDFFDFTFVPSAEIFQAVATTLAGLFGGIIIMFIGGVRLTQTKIFKRISLEEVQDSKEGYTSHFIKDSMLGKTGTAYTVLRPSGKVMIDGTMYDAFTRGDFISKGSTIEVIDEEGGNLKVKEVEQ